MIFITNLLACASPDKGGHQRPPANCLPDCPGLLNRRSRFRFIDVCLSACAALSSTVKSGGSRRHELHHPGAYVAGYTWSAQQGREIP